MRLSAFSLAFIPVLGLCFLFFRNWLPAFLAFSACLQGASVIDISIGQGFYGVSPYSLTALCCALVLCARLFGGDHRTWFVEATQRPLFFLSAYLAVSVIGAFTLPVVFSGTPVYLLISRSGFDGDLAPLTFTLSNFAQAVNLLVHAVAVIYLAAENSRDSHASGRLLAGVVFAAAFVTIVGGYERFASLQGEASLRSFFQNNPGYVHHILERTGGHAAGILRIPTPFSESSYASAFLSAVLLGALATLAFGQHYKPWLLAGATLLFAALINTMGSTGWASAGAGIFGIILWGSHRLCRSAAVAGRIPAVTVGTVFVTATVLAGLAISAYLSSPELRQAVEETVLYKLESRSGQQRTHSNWNAIFIVRDTYGLGVGLGSNRASSFLASLVSNTGIAGALLFLAMLGCILWRYLRAPQLSDAQIFVGTALATATLAMSLAIPDLNLPIYWVFIFLGILFCPPASTADQSTESASRG